VTDINTAKIDDAALALLHIGLHDGCGALRRYFTGTRCIDCTRKATSLTRSARPSRSCSPRRDCASLSGYFASCFPRRVNKVRNTAPGDRKSSPTIAKITAWRNYAEALSGIESPS
jgi:hypothetical protein